MRRTGLALAGLGALVMLAGCADGAGYYYGAGYGNQVYYDGYYGPYTDGYWGPDAVFYYRGGDGRFLRDDGRHFRRDRFDGGRAYRWHGRRHWR